MMLSLDIETACGVSECSGKGCDHALHPTTGRITVVGVWSPEIDGAVFRGPDAIQSLREFLAQLPSYKLVGQNLRFDLKFLALAGGLEIDVERWEDDTQFMAANSIVKIPQDWLRAYEARRKEENKKLPKGASHRVAGQHSLKTLAPYFLGVDPFWETPDNHDNDEYVLKDCKYTYRLYEFFNEELRRQGTYEFYKTKFMPWCRTLLRSEIRGITLDLDAVRAGLSRSEVLALEKKEELDRLWAPVYNTHRTLQVDALDGHYLAAADVAVSKLKGSTPAKEAKTRARYEELRRKAAEKLGPPTMNLNSPTQLAWIFRDHFGLDITDFDGEDSTGKAVLQRLASQGRDDIKTFLEYRKYSKLASAFFPSYLELNRNGVIHCNFNPDGTRTGRSSSSGPNLQQVPGELHALFRARPGMKLADYDMSAIEAKIIAFYTEDPNLVHLVNSGDDFHGFNVVNAYFKGEITCEPNQVKDLFPLQRKMAKELGYALFYGAGWRRIQNVAMKYGYQWSEEVCREKLRNFKDIYAAVFRFKAQIDEMAQTQPIPNYFGFQVAYPDHEDIYMKAFNTLIQGTASMMVLDAMHGIEQDMAAAGIDGRPLLFVHDEIVVEFDETKEAITIEIIQRNMTKYDLPTTFGDIKLQCEGKTSYVWEK